MTKNITKIIAGLGVVAGLGIAALPLSSYAANPQNVLVSVTIEPTAGTVEPLCNNSTAPVEGSGGAGETITTDTCAILGSSNAGINITIQDSDATTALTYSSYTIPAIPVTAELTDALFAYSNISSINAGAGGWGYNFAVVGTNITSSSANWNGVPAYNSPTTIASSTSSTTATALTTGSNIKFRAVTPTTQAPGTYTDTVILTVTPQP